MAKIALTSRFGRQQEMRAVAAYLESLGHAVVSRWLVVEQDQDTQELAQMCLDDIGQADVVVAYTDAPDTPGAGRGGRHAEFGAAAMTFARLILVGRREHLLHHLARVEQVATTSEMVRLLDLPAGSVVPR